MSLRSCARIAAAVFILIAYSYPAASQTPGTWTATGSMTTPRYNGGQGVPLANGKVLMAGGGICAPGCLAGAAPQSSAELYDPTTGTWSATGSMTTARQGHSMTRLPDGRVLAAGGLGLATAELYDPATESWTLTGSMSAANAYHTATVLPNGQVLVAGGYNGVVYATAQLYDPASGTWSATGSMGSARYSHVAALLPNGTVLVAAGGSTSAEVYDPDTGTWSATGSMTTARYAPAVSLQDGKVLVPGGQLGYGVLASAELYDPDTGIWLATGSLSDSRAGHSATLLADGSVLIASGLTGNLFCGSPTLPCTGLTSAEIYTPTTGTWSATGSITTARYGHGAALLQDGTVVIAGGNDIISVSLASAELFTPPISDTDADGALDNADNCPAVANAEQADTDGDGSGDACDVDDDNDGATDATDAFPLDATESTDTDGDGTGNNADLCPLDPVNDPDGDGVCSSAVARGDSLAYISNFNDQTVSVIDTATNSVTATLPVSGPCRGTAPRPFGVAGHPSGRRVYVADVGNSVRGCGGVSVIDTTSNTQVATIGVDSVGQALCGIHGIAVNAAGTRLYVSTIPECGGGPGAFYLVVIDTATNAAIATVPAGSGGAAGIAVDPAGTRVYLSNPLPNTISVVDTTTNTLVAQVPVGSFPWGVVVDPTGTRVYVANINSNSVSVIDTGDNTVIATIPVGSAPYGVALNPVGTRLYVTNNVSNTASVIDTATNTVIATVPVGLGPLGVALTPAGTSAYVANINSNDVSVIDTNTNTVIATVAVGNLPHVFGQFIVPVSAADNCPLVSNADQTDTDGDRSGEVCDTDDDNDNVSDVDDAFPLDASESVDTDGDGIGNNADPDDDNDSFFDIVDGCPLVPGPANGCAPDVAVDNLQTDIRALDLAAASERLLTTTLINVDRAIDNGNVAAAQGQLRAFVQQVRALEQRGQLSAEVAAALIAEANGIAAGL